jgi:hypothetical protein
MAELKGLDCFVVGSHFSTARLFPRSDINYSLLLFDDTEEGAELMRFTRSLPHREGVAVILVKQSEDFGRLLNRIRRLLGKTRAP